MKKLLFLLVSFLYSVTAFAQLPDLKSDAPFDANVRTGVLPNGLKYYIRKNVKPEHRAELRLVVNAGSTLETDNQLGLAHLVEHMCFNGTKNFQKSAIVDFLESAGMNFGADLNAYTSFDETVYMLQIPTDTLSIFLNGFQILEDWAHNVTFDNKEIDKERGVVVEEWRLGQGAEERMLRKWFPVVFNNSQYANRLPIGTKEIIEGAPYDTIKQFYKDWYRPDLMGVIAVGDFDMDEVEKIIKDKFSNLINPAQPKERKYFPVPDNDKLLVSVCTDKEASYSLIQLMYKTPVTPKKTIGDYRNTYLKSYLFSGMLNDRYNELMQKANPPFSYAGSNLSDMTRTSGAFTSYAVVSDDGIEHGLKTLLDENKRVKQFGFTATELERQKKQLLRGIEQLYNEKDKTESKSYANEYVRHFLTGEPSGGIEFDFNMYKQFLPTITLDEINLMASQLITDGKNCVIVITAPQKDGMAIPSEEKVKQIFTEQQNTVVTAYSDVVINKPLLKKKPKAGKVVSENSVAQYGITEWTLSNGAKVILKPTDFKNDQILFSAFSFGGSSLYPDKDDMSASYAPEVITKSGLGPFDATTLSKYLSDKVVSLSPSISETTESLRGSASPKDLETLLQLLHLYFTEPKSDSTGFKSMMSQELTSIQNRQNNPNTAFGDTINVTMNRYHFRHRPINESILREIDMKRAHEIFKDRFADGGEFTYIFVGNFKPAEIKPLIESYIGGLPSKGRTETFKDLGITTPTGTISKTIFKGADPKSSVAMFFTGPFVYNRHNRMEVYAMTKLLDIRLREVLREDMGGVYGVGVGPDLQHYPHETYQMGIYFGCAPDNVDKLIAASLSVLDSVKMFGCNDKDLLKVKELTLKERETQLKENSFWLNVISSSKQNNENILELQDFEKQINALTSDDFKRLVAQYFNMNNFAKFVLNPEKTP